MGIAKLKNGGSGSKIINGIVKEFLAQNEDIAPNTFVEFVNNFSISNATKHSSYTSFTPTTAVQLGNNSILLGGVSSNTAKFCVVSFNGSTFTIGTVIEHYTGQGETKLKLLRVSDTKAFALFMGTGKGSAVVLTVNNTTITKGKALTFTDIGSIYGLDMSLLSSNKVLAFIGEKLVLFSISSSNTVSKGTAVSLTNIDNTSSNKTSVQCFSDTDAIILYQKKRGTSTYFYDVYIQKVTVSGTTITLGEAVEVNIPNNMPNYGGLYRINSNTFVLLTLLSGRVSAFGSGSMQNMFGTIIKVVDGEICIGETVFLEKGYGELYESLGFSLIGDIDFMISSTYHNGSKNSYMLTMVHIDGFLLCPSTPVDSGMNYIHSIGVKYNDTRIFGMVSGYPYYFDFDNTVKIKKSVGKCHGLTKSKATATTKGKVIIPN